MYVRRSQDRSAQATALVGNLHEGGKGRSPGQVLFVGWFVVVRSVWLVICRGRSLGEAGLVAESTVSTAGMTQCVRGVSRESTRDYLDYLENGMQRGTG